MKKDSLATIASMEQSSDQTLAVVVDADDNLLPGSSVSMTQVHTFSEAEPHGILHRAACVLLFDENDHRMLLVQRSKEHDLFRNMWTNACCTHPTLNGRSSDSASVENGKSEDVDETKDVLSGKVSEVKEAAARQLLNDIGLTVDESAMKFLTRIRYWAADTATHGPNATLGEHEITHVLVATLPNRDAVELKLNPQVVQNALWVDSEELASMMRNKEKYAFSPLFQLIYFKWLRDCWWNNLSEIMTSDKWADFESIHEYDPPAEFFGGAGHARPLFVHGGDASKKQGAYGKIKIHKESKLKQILHIDEVVSALLFLYVKPLDSNIESDYVRRNFDHESLTFCDEILVEVSRSFAAVIRQLPSSMVVDVLIFYLVLRALDTIEDDMTAFKDNKEKIEHLLAFHKNALQNPEWCMDGVGEGDEKRLLQEFTKCHKVYAALKPQSRRIISDITHRMAMGMAEFIGKDLGQGTVDVQQFNRYCHFVAGLVGEGLSRLFAASGLESPSYAVELFLSDQMGMFLQKTNIIRDYLEDYVDRRAFWPQTIWKKYSETGDLGYFCNQDDSVVRVKSIQCLNELVTDALELVPDCLTYLSNLECVEIFRFCAIPQVMAIATLDKCYANPDVFTGVVKIRKGLSCKLILNSTSPAKVHEVFFNFAQSIMRKATSNRLRGVVDPSYDRTMLACEAIVKRTRVAALGQKRTRSMRLLACMSILFISLLWEHVLLVLPSAVAKLDILKDPVLAQRTLLVLASVVYLYGPFEVPSNLKTANLLKKTGARL